MKKSLLLIAAFAFTSCGEDSARPEIVDKLRGLGVAAVPLVTSASVEGEAPKTTELTVYAALPLGQEMTIEPFQDDASTLGVVLAPDQISFEPPTYEDRADLRIASFKAKVIVPPAKAFARFGGKGQVRYGFKLNVGAEEEKLIGNFLVYPDGAPELAWTAPTATIVAPTDGAAIPAGGKTPLVAELGDANDEDLKLGWFTTAGEIKNRRAKSTSWEAKKAGPRTLILTARGRKSRGFAMQIITLDAQ